MADLSRRVYNSYGISPIMPVDTGFMEVVFTWDAVGGADSYQLEIGTTSGASDTLVRNVGNVLTYTYTLAPGDYFSRVKAVTGGTPGTASVEQETFV